LLAKFWGREKVKKEQKQIWRRNQFLHVHRTIVKKPDFCFQWIFERFFLSPIPIMRALLKSFKVQFPIFQKPRSKERNQKNQKRIITCGLDENYYPFNFYVDLCFQREKISHRAR